MRIGLTDNNHRLYSFCCCSCSSSALCSSSSSSFCLLITTHRDLPYRLLLPQNTSLTHVFFGGSSFGVLRYADGFNVTFVLPSFPHSSPVPLVSLLSSPFPLLSSFLCFPPVHSEGHNLAERE